MSITRLLIARHGNTFTPEQTPTRVGLNTDIPLVGSGKEQATRLGNYLKDNNIIPNEIYTSILKRTIEMGSIIENTIGVSIHQEQHEMFNEIDYGPDENMPESTVIQRIGTKAISDWNEKTIVPDGWIVNPDKIIQDWIYFGEECLSSRKNTTTLAITSNGIARFAPHLTGNFNKFDDDLKISTGALCILEKSSTDNNWVIKGWNVKP